MPWARKSSAESVGTCNTLPHAELQAIRWREHRGRGSRILSNHMTVLGHVVQEPKIQDVAVLELSLDLAGVSTPPFSPQLPPGAQ